MSRIRSIHPGIWTDEEFVSLSAFARLFLIGLWNECDDKGIFPWSPLKMKMRILPADSCDASELLSEIEAAGIIKSYSIGGKTYGAVRNFSKFQRPKKPNDIYPETQEIAIYCGRSSEPKQVGCPSMGNQLPTGGEINSQMEDGGGNRSKRDTIVSPKRKNKTPFPSNFSPEPKEGTKTARLMARWDEKTLEHELEAFESHWRRKGDPMLDWNACWSTWVLNGDKFSRQAEQETAVVGI